MKLISIIAIVLAVICSMTEYALNYWCGYYEESLRPIFWSLIPALIDLLILPLFLLTIWIISLFKKKHRLWTTAMLIGILALMGLMRTLPPATLIMYGMRDRMMRDYSLDDLRHLARDVDRIPRSPDLPGSTTKGWMRDELGETGLKKKYSFLMWPKDPDIQGPSYIAETDGVVDVRWGGALIGHWGFSVAVNGKRIELDPGTKISRVSDDIFFVFEYD